MTFRTNLLAIVTSHVKTLTDLRTGKVQLTDVIVYYVCPLILAILMVVYFGPAILLEQVDRILTAVSIIGGFLFALFAYIVSVIDNLKLSGETDIIRNKFSREIHSNIAYSIILSLINIVLLVGAGFLTGFSDQIENIFVDIYLGAVYFFAIHFLATLLLVVSRVFIIVDSK